MKHLKSLVAAFSIALVVSGLTALPVLDGLHSGDTDYLHLFRAILAPVETDPADSPVVVVAISAETYAFEQLAGIPRIMWTSQMAAVQDKVLGGGATVYGWDIIPYSLTAPSLRSLFEGRVDVPPDTLRNLNRLDQPMLNSIKTFGRGEGRVVLGWANLKFGPVRPHPSLIRLVGGNDSVRSVNAYFEWDGVLRGVPLGRYDPESGTMSETAFALEIAQRHSGGTIEAGSPTDFTFNGTELPVVSSDGTDTNLLVNFDTSPGAIPTYSFHDLLGCQDDAYFKEHFEGKAVIFGVIDEFEDRKIMSNYYVTWPDFYNAPPTCFDHPVSVPDEARLSEAGVYIHAQAVRNLLEGNPVKRPGDGLRFGLAFAMALVGAGIAAWRKPISAFGLTSLVGLAYIITAAYAFQDGTELPLVDTMASGLVALAGMIGFRFVTADRERQLVRKTFSQYLDRKVIEAMVDSDDIPELGGESRQLTCFFSDIEAFSSISEKMGPPELVAFLNEYFKIIGEEIEDKGGIIERFLGDAVCAVFGAPVRDENHAVSAVRCALAIDRDLAAAQDRFDVPEGRFVRTRIGINTGAMTAGNVGAERRKTYTVMGDSVNLAARLESVNKQYGTLLMAGEETVKATGDLFEWRLLDRVRVVGRRTPVGLFEPLGEKGSVPAERLALRDAYEAALERFGNRDFDGAKAAFAILAEAGDTASSKAMERCDGYMSDPPPDNWDGVTDLTKK